MNKFVVYLYYKSNRISRIKMKYHLRTTIVLAGLTFLLPGIISGQKRATLVLPESKVTVGGTSSLHDWEVEIKKFSAEFYIEESGTGDLLIKEVNSVFNAASLTSDNGIMTGKAHDALRVKEFPEITFKSPGIKVISFKDGEVNGTIDGELRLAGATRNISVTFTGRITGNQFQINGSHKINMVDYRIKPPTAMLGTLKTGEVVTVDFDLEFLLAR